MRTSFSRCVAIATLFLVAFACLGQAPPIRRGDTLPPAPAQLQIGPDGYFAWTPQRTGALTSRISYVASNGDDSTARRYLVTDAEIKSDIFNPPDTILAFATIGAALQSPRDGCPDAVLIRRGDSFDIAVPLQGYLLKGMSSTKPALIGAYGPLTSPRPILKQATHRGAIFLLQNDRDGKADKRNGNLLIQSLELTAPRRNPNDPAYSPTTWPDGGAAITTYAFASSVYFDDIRISYFGGCIALQGIDWDKRTTDVVFNRCTFDHVWATGREAHSSGVYCSLAWRITFRDCYFVANGYNPASIDSPGNFYNQNLYFAQSCGMVTFTSNLSAKSAHAGAQFRGGHDNKVVGNILLLNPFGLGIGHDQNFFPGEYCSASVYSNVIAGTRDTRPDTPRGFGLSINRMHTATINNNLISGTPDTTSTGNIYAITASGLPAPHVQSITIGANTIHAYASPSTDGCTLQLGTAAAPMSPNVRFLSNTMLCPTNLLAFSQNASWGGTFANNTASLKPCAETTQCTVASKGNQLLGRDAALASFGPGAFAITIQAPPPSVDAGDYAAELGIGTTTDDYLNACLFQRRGHWDVRLEPHTLVNWFRRKHGLATIPKPR